MKYTDLKEDQRKHFYMLVEDYGVPEKATHFDMEDSSRSSFLYADEGVTYYLSGFGDWRLFVDYNCLSEDKYVEIPEKPWYDPADVAFKNSKEVSQMIGKWYTVIDPESDYVNLTGECVDYDGHFGTVTLKFPRKCKERFTVGQVVEEGADQGCENTKDDMVKRPNHYQLLPEYEVKDINKALLDKIQESDFDMSLYEAGWYQQAMQYFLRFYAKNGVEDLEKGVETMQFVIDSLKERKSNE